MARNWIQFQKGYRLTQFVEEYGSEDQCMDALFRWCWPNGFVCPRCEHTANTLSDTEPAIARAGISDAQRSEAEA